MSHRRIAIARDTEVDHALRRARRLVRDHGVRPATHSVAEALRRIGPIPAPDAKDAYPGTRAIEEQRDEGLP